MIGRIALVLMAGASLASADPAPAPKPVAKPAAKPVPAQAPLVLPDPPPKPSAPLSLRNEATRVTTDLVAGQDAHRDPDLLVAPWQIGRWSASGRAGKLEGGAAAATFVGEAVLGLGGSPLAAIGLLAAGATLDAAASDVEAASPPREKPKAKPKRIKHKLR